jgi:multiple sugar transport system permease protein
MNKGLSIRARNNLYGWLFILPALLCFIVFILIPTVTVVMTSLTNYDMFSTVRFVGLLNFARVFRDKVFIRSLVNICYYVVLYVPLLIAFSFVFANLLNNKIRSIHLFRTMYYLPGLTSAVASSLVWSWLLNPNFGLVNQILGLFGIRGPLWLAHSTSAMPSIVIICLWMTLGGNTLIYLATLQSIPPSLYEAAEIDGANWFQRMMHITAPLSSPTTYFLIIIGLIGAFQLFDQTYVLTRGGPANATMVPVYLIYTNAFTELQVGYASAQSVVLFLLILVSTQFVRRFNKERFF